MKQEKSSKIGFGRLTMSLVRILAYILFLIILLFLYSSIVGVPKPLRDLAVEKLAEYNCAVSLTDLRIDAFEGLVLSNLNYYQTETNETPLFQAEKISSWAPLKYLFDEDRATFEMNIQKGVFYPSESMARRIGLPNEISLQPVKGISGDFSWSQDDLLIDSCQAVWDDLSIDLSGRIYFDDWGSSGFGSHGKRAGESGELLSKYFVRLATSEWQKIVFKDGPQAKLNFSIDLSSPQTDQIKLSFSRGPFCVQDTFFSGLDFRFGLENGKFNLESNLRRAQKRLFLSGSYNSEEKTSEIELEGELSFQTIKRFMPQEWRSWINDAELGMEAGLSLQVSLDSLGEDRPFQDISGEVSAHRLNCSGVVASNLMAKFQLTETGLKIDPIKLEMPSLERGTRNFAGGESVGSVRLDRESRQLDLDLDINCDPWLLRSFVGPTTRRIVERFEFFGAPPELQLSIRKNLGSNSVQVSGQLDATNAAYRKVSADTIKGQFEYNPDKLKLKSLQITSSEGKCTSDIEVDYQRRVVNFKGESSLPPLKLSSMISSALAKSVRKFTFPNNPQIVCSGSYGMDDPAKTDFSGQLSSASLGTPFAKCERVEIPFEMRAQTLQFKDIYADLYGGNLKGTAKFDLRPPADRPSQYRVACTASNIDLSGLVSFHKSSAVTDQLGKVSGQLEISGDVEKNFLSTATGTGSVHIAGEGLVQLPILKRLTRILQRVYSKFNIFSQTELSSSFALKQGALYTEDIALEGDLLSLSAKGVYYFDKRGLNMMAEIKPFRSGFFSSLVRILSMPVSKIMAFQLTGTLEDPKWHFSNLPYEIFKIPDFIGGSNRSDADANSD